jgi:hypothetical protein
MAAAEEVRWGEVEEDPLVASVDVAGVTLAYGRKTSQRFTPLSSRQRRTGWSLGSRPKKTTHLNYLFVRFLI